MPFCRVWMGRLVHVLGGCCMVASSFNKTNECTNSTYCSLGYVRYNCPLRQDITVRYVRYNCPLRQDITARYVRYNCPAASRYNCPLRQDITARQTRIFSMVHIILFLTIEWTTRQQQQNKYILLVVRY